MKLLTYVTILIVGVGISASIHAQAKSLTKQSQAQRLKNRIEEEVMDIKGVNGIGISACDSDSGDLDVEAGNEACVVIYAESEGGAKRAEKYYPSGDKVDGIYIWVKVIGKVHPEPRMSGGN